MRLRPNQLKLIRDLFGGSVKAMLFASLFAGAGPPLFAAPHTTCVNNASDFRNELVNAGTGGINNDADNHINLAVGVYQINGTIFQYASAKTFTLDITGGYNSNCTKQVTQNPIYTVLSGVGSSDVILQSNSMGDVSIRFVTFTGGEGGTVSSGGSALDMNGLGSTGQIIIDNDIFTANTGGGAINIEASSLVQLDSSLFYGNSGEVAFALSGVAKFFAINNTFAQNTLDVAALGVELRDAASGANLGNNIFFDTVDTEVLFGDSGTALLANNVMPSDVLNTFSTYGATVTEDDLPVSDIQFVSSTDFRLQATSPGIAAGTLTPPNYTQPGGELPAQDIEGNARTFNGAVDVGAYERGNEIFKDGFEF